MIRRLAFTTTLCICLMPLLTQAQPTGAAGGTKKSSTRRPATVATTSGITSAPRLPVVKPETVGMSSERLARIDAVVKEAIDHHNTPGAVVLIGHKGKIVYRKAYGNRSLEPQTKPMELSTVFDMASITKVVATTTSLMILLEQGAFRLDDPVSKYLPEFATPVKEAEPKSSPPQSATTTQSAAVPPTTPTWDATDKSKITIRQLMTHFSGLKPDFNLFEKWSGYEEALRRLKTETLQSAPGTKFVYSDLNYIALGELVLKLSGTPLEVFARQHVFEPLGMRDTSFKPDASHRLRAAPTEKRAATEAYLGGKEASGPGDQIIQGEVHDPTAWRMGGVAGHAGLFSTADDLSVYCQMILNLGEFRGKRILSPLGVKTMTSNQVPASLAREAPGNVRVARGLGWDIASSYSSNRGDLFPANSFGHTGFTGTDLWIDPSTSTFLILLTNRVHPNGKGNVTELRAKVANVLSASILESK
ncbi:MAG: serine hydrolase domain-containing protein [Terriglobia bacterium]